MDIASHRYRTVERFGQNWEPLHQWLDRYYGRLQDWHRIILHHQAGVELAVQEFGEGARMPAILHIQDDWDGALPTGPWATAQFYTAPDPEIALGIIEELRRLYGTDGGLAKAWGVEG